MPTNQVVYHGDIEREWGWIEPILLRVVGRREYPRHTIEFLLDECRSGRAQLFLCSLDPEAFGIVSVLESKLDGEKNLHILVAHTKRKLQKGIIPFVKELASLLGCKTITMRSNRRGFQRTGWKLAGYCYEMGVGDG